MNTRLVATKTLSYATRRLLPDDAFEAKNPRDAKLLVAIGKARYVTDAEAVEEKKSVPAKPVQQKPDPEFTAEELVDLAEAMPFAKFRAAAFAILGDTLKGNATKADIVSALEAKTKNG